VAGTEYRRAMNVEKLRQIKLKPKAPSRYRRAMTTERLGALKNRSGRRQIATRNAVGPGVLASNSFLLAIGEDLFSFSKVSNISRAIDYDTIIEGGVNTTVHTFTKPKQNQETLILEKGVGVSREREAALYEEYNLKPGGRIKKAVTLVVLGDKTENDRYYSFNEGVVVKWEVGNLDALSKEVLIERFEIAHSGLLEL